MRGKTGTTFDVNVGVTLELFCRNNCTVECEKLLLLLLNTRLFCIQSISIETTHRNQLVFISRGTTFNIDFDDSKSVFGA